MKHATRRILSFSLAILLVATGFVCNTRLEAFSSSYGMSSTLGSSGALGKSGSTASVGFSVQDAALTIDAIHVSNFTQLRTAVNGATGPVYIVLEKNITVENNLLSKYDVTIDGQGLYTLTQDSYQYYIYPAANTTFTFYRLTLKPLPYSFAGFIRCPQNVTVVFDEVDTARGGLIVAGSGEANTLVFRNSHMETGSSQVMIPFNLITNIIFEGESNSFTATLPTSNVFATMFKLYGTGSKITVAEGTQVYFSVPKKSVFGIPEDVGSLYGATDLTIGDGGGIYIEAESLLATARGFKDVHIGEGATYSFNQTQKVEEGMVSRVPLFYAQNFTMEKDSVFITHALETNRPVIIGLDVRYNATLNSPKYVSIYSPGGAYNHTRSNTLWQLNDIDYIHYWEKEPGSAAAADPKRDETNFAPHYSWTAAHLGRYFTVTATNSQGVRSTSEPDGMPNMAPNSNKVGTLEQTLRFDNENAQRLVIGVPLDVELPPPVPETLEMVSVPKIIDFGTHDLPVETTLYGRQDCDSVDEDGNMLIHIRDTRRTDTAPWSLHVQLTDIFTNTANAQPIDGKPLVFVHNGNTMPIDNEGVLVYASDMGDEQVDHILTWGNDEGLLMQIKPGDATVGDHIVALKWSLQIAP